MEYLESKPITGPMPVREALQYPRQICDALDTAHRNGIIHRDLKPDNILDGKMRIKILDFGVAKFEHASAGDDDKATTPLTADGVVVGTPQYMSPNRSGSLGRRPQRHFRARSRAL